MDSQTSSAGEVFARHFQRSGRGTVIGDQISGRVTAARLFSRTAGTDVVVLYGVSVAVGRVLFPGGEELEGKGVTPDRYCVPAEDDLREKRDPCGKLALQLARQALGLPPPPP